MVGRLTLDQVVKVRVLAPQLSQARSRSRVSHLRGQADNRRETCVKTRLKPAASPPRSARLCDRKSRSWRPARPPPLASSGSRGCTYPARSRCSSGREPQVPRSGVYGSRRQLGRSPGESLGHDRSTPGHVCVVRHEYGAASPLSFTKRCEVSAYRGTSRPISLI